MHHATVFNYFESGTLATGMLYTSHRYKISTVMQNAVTENPQKKYQTFQVHMDQIRQIASQNMLYSRGAQHRYRGSNVAR